jgi:lipid-binding SYLF domain-containing protein
MHQGRSNYPKFQIHKKTLSTTEVVSGAGKLSGTRKRDQSLFSHVLRSAKGIAILRVLKGGFFVSGRIGEGVVIARLPEDGWSGPSAIGTGGAGFGFQIGGQVTEFVIILNTRAAVKAFARRGQRRVRRCIKCRRRSGRTRGRSGDSSSRRGLHL